MDSTWQHTLVAVCVGWSYTIYLWEINYTNLEDVGYWASNDRMFIQLIEKLIFTNSAENFSW